MHRLVPASWIRGAAALLAGAALAGGAIAAEQAQETPPTHAGSPRLHVALKDLVAARNALEHAQKDHAGHSDKALALIDKAIAEVRLGMQTDRAH